MAREKFSVKEIFEGKGEKVGLSDNKTAIPSDSKKVGKGKKSFTIERNVINDLETLAWYIDKSSSEVVEEAIRKHLDNNKKLLERAKEVREAKR